MSTLHITKTAKCPRLCSSFLTFIFQNVENKGIVYLDLILIRRVKMAEDVHSLKIYKELSNSLSDRIDLSFVPEVKK